MCQGMAQNLKRNNMRTFLTGPYLSLMNAFTHHSDARIEELCKTDCYIPPMEVLLKEYCTLRMDGGRQSGKSTAVTDFAYNWLYNGGTVIVLSNTSAYARVSYNSIKNDFIRFNDEDIRHRLFHDSLRSFIGNEGSKFRGLALSRVLYIIDEPIKAPDMDKIYDAHIKVVQHCCRASCEETNETTRPLFFVIGMQ
ncbi:hypothetical protein [Escherichia phage PSD2001]|nr:hypothetical protein [Escherichia phage PSD2001]